MRLCFLMYPNQPWEIAPTGQPPSQEPQLMQSPLMTYAKGNTSNFLRLIVFYHKILKLQC